MVLYILIHLLGSFEIFALNSLAKNARVLFKLLNEVSMLWLVG